VLRHDFDAQASVLHLSYRYRAGAGKPTEIYVNMPMRYSNGVNVAVSHQGAVSVTTVHNAVVISHSSSLTDGTIVDVVVSPL